MTDFTGTNTSKLKPDSLVVNREHYPAHSADPSCHSQCSIGPSDDRRCTAQKEEKEEGAEGEEAEAESGRDQVEVCVGRLDAVRVPRVSGRLSREVSC
jgi:hypothetical protein